MRQKKNTLYITNNTKIEEELESECYTYRTCDRDDATTTDYDSTEEEEEDKIHFIENYRIVEKNKLYIFEKN